jgi:hypothetical protein
MQITYCKVREGDWNDVSIQTLDGQDGWGIFNTDLSVYAICVATCSDTGMSVITDNWDTYYLVPSVDLEFRSTLEALGSLERDY